MKSKFLAGVAGVLLIASCASASSAELRMSWWGGDSRHQATQAALKVCGAKYGHTIKPEFTGFSGHLEKLTTQIAGGTEADIMQVNWPWLPLFSLDGNGFLDLSSEADTLDLSNWSAGELNSATINGKLNGVPVSMTGRVFMFDETPYKKAGLSLPKSWDDLIADAPVFKQKLGQDYFPLHATGLNVVFLVSQIAAQKTGKDLIDPSTNKVAWSKDDLTFAIKFYGNLVEKGVLPTWKSNAAEGNVELYETKKWATGHLGGSYEWDSTYFKYSDPMDKDQHLVPSKILKIDGAVTEGAYKKPSMVFAISKHSKNPKAAAQIINCLLNEPEGIEALGATRGVPSSKAAKALLQEKGSIDPILLQANKIVAESEGPTVSPFNEHPKVRAVFQDTLEEYAYGKISAEDAADEIIDGINDALYDFQ